LLAALLTLLLPVYADAAHGEPHRSQHEQRQDYEPRRSGSGQRPMREAIGEVEQNYRGHVVDVQSLRKDSNEDVYRMRVLQRDGRVKTVTVPANEQEQRQRR
jgi:uncharacterized membrane protein YkoI